MEFEPTIRPRNYAPERLFVTKWDVEINNNRIKDKSRRRERYNKYFNDTYFNDTYFNDYFADIPPIQVIVAVQNFIEKRKLDDDIYEPRKRSRFSYE